MQVSLAGVAEDPSRDVWSDDVNGQVVGLQSLCDCDIDQFYRRKMGPATWEPLVVLAFDPGLPLASLVHKQRT